MFGRGRERRRAERIDPFEVGEPWRRFVQGALQSQARYQRAVSGVAAGPLRERLEDIGRRVEEATQECWRTARRADALEAAVSAVDVAGTRARLEAASSDAGQAGDEDPTVASLRAQLSTAERLEAMVAGAQGQLARVEAGLGRAAATAVELCAHRAGSADTTALSSDIDGLVDDITALRTAFAETQALG